MADKGAWPRSMLLEFSNQCTRKKNIYVRIRKQQQHTNKAQEKKPYVLWNQKPGFGLAPHCRKRVAVVGVAAIGAGPEVCFVVAAVYGVGGRTAALGGNADECLRMRVGREETVGQDEGGSDVGHCWCGGGGKGASRR